MPVSVPLTNLDLDALNTQVQANSYSNNQQSQAIVTLEQLIFERATIDYVDNKIADLQEQINSLTEIVKGAVARYTVANNIGTPVSRPGEISCNAGYWSALTRFSFGTADASGTTTPIMSNDDIIEIYDAAEGDTSHYKITNASGETFETPVINYENQKIWGLTLGFTLQFLELVEIDIDIDDLYFRPA